MNENDKDIEIQKKKGKSSIDSMFDDTPKMARLPNNINSMFNEVQQKAPLSNNIDSIYEPIKERPPVQQMKPPTKHIDSMFNNIQKQTPLPKNINSIFREEKEIQKSNEFTTNISNDKPLFTYYKTSESPKSFNDQKNNTEKIEAFKTPDVQNNTLNSELNMDWEDFFNSMNNQIIEKKSEDLKYANNNSDSKESENEVQTFMVQRDIDQKNNFQDEIFKYGESLELGILAIYYICDIFPKKIGIDKIFFSGSELNFILNKHSQFFYIIKEDLEKRDLIQYYGTLTKKEKSNEKIYIITEKGKNFSIKIIESRKQDFPILIDKFIITLEKKYTEYNKDLIGLENKNIIRSQWDINNELRKMADDNDIELVTSYISDTLNIKFLCKKCKKLFENSYQQIKNRENQKLFCPYCHPELMRNMYVSENLKIKISEFVFRELKKITLHKLSNNEIVKIRGNLKKSTIKFIESLILEKKPTFKEFIEKYIYSIVDFLTEVKCLYETNQFINLSEISLLFHDNSIVSESKWQGLCEEIIKYLREEFAFNIRSKRYNSIARSAQKSINSYKILLKLIINNTVAYLDIDYKSEIKIYYNGKCQGINGHCLFDIDYKFLPALSFDHRLEKYNSIIKKEGYEYIPPKKILCGHFNITFRKIKSQIGGLDLKCINCHVSRHHKMYHFPLIFDFLKSLHIRNIDEDISLIKDNVNNLVHNYIKHIKKDTLEKKDVSAKILARVKSQILRLIKKKYAIEYLFGENYICPTCGKANINDHLDCFDAHHTNENLFNHSFHKIRFGLYYFKSVKWLITNLIAQECVYICKNCHTMIKAVNYNDNVLIILENELDALYINNFYDNLYKSVSKKRNIILQWKSQLQSKMNAIPNPLLEMFDYGETIFSVLICIYYICEIFSKDTKKDFFIAEELNYIQEKSYSFFKQYKNNLIDLEYIQYEKRLHEYKGFGFNKDIYKITFKGILKAKEMIEKKLSEFPEEFNALISVWKERSEKFNSIKLRLSASNLVLICIYFICNKGKNNYFLNVFHYVINKDNSYFSKHRKKLLNLGYITEYQETANSFKKIDITLEGRKKAEELISLIKNENIEKYQNLISNWEKRYNEYFKIS